jgi:DNA-directed RNA polymerase subunit RPC12/RpoP
MHLKAIPMASAKSDLKLRERAKDHLEQAKSLLGSPSETSARYAALELRLSIECLSYRLLEAYKSQASFDAVRKWQPDKMLKELVAVAGGVTSDLTITIDMGDGEPLVATEMRPDVKWIRSSWQLLGSYLHTPTIKQIIDNTEKSSSAISKKLQPIVEELERVLSSEVFDIVLEFGTAWPCSCGFMIHRSPAWLASNNITSCPDCGAEYEVHADNGEIKYRPIAADWRCELCGTGNQISMHKIKNKAKIACTECGADYELKEFFRMIRI